VLGARLNVGARDHYHRAAAAPPVFRYALWTQKRVFSSTEPNTSAAAHTTHNEERTDIQVIAHTSSLRWPFMTASTSTDVFLQC
jgi:hypothetical protein